MAKYIYKNTHFLLTMDPKRIIKMQGSKCSQTLYLCLVTGRIFFYLSPPTSKLNNNLNIYFPFFSDNKIELWFLLVLPNSLLHELLPLPLRQHFFALAESDPYHYPIIMFRSTKKQSKSYGICYLVMRTTKIASSRFY